jgi:hypothetical protein
MQLLKLFKDHDKSFPTLWIFGTDGSTCHVVEVGCERFFAVSQVMSFCLGIHDLGYIIQRNYKCTMLLCR